ncbi:MAG: response regulator, partial [bacterium]|nr:response regulator [bacterium]
MLVIDDEKNIVELLKYNLEKEGYDVVCAYDGIEAINTARQERPDLIILDIMLPGQGGLEVCRIIRKETKTPIIMATAKGDEIDKILGL